MIQISPAFASEARRRFDLALRPQADTEWTKKVTNEPLGMAMVDIQRSALLQVVRLHGMHTQFHEDIHYWLHLALTNLWGSNAPRPWRHIADVDGRRNDRGGMRLLGYVGASQLDTLKEHAEINGTPDILNGIEAIEVKRMPAAWRNGMELNFDLVALPWISLGRDCPLPNLRGERDIFDLQLALGLVNRGSESETYEAWMRKQLLNSGADLLGLSSIVWDRRQMVRRTQGEVRRAATFLGKVVQWRGRLRITNGELFNMALRTGVGRGRAFGYGMLMIKA